MFEVAVGFEVFSQTKIVMASLVFCSSVAVSDCSIYCSNSQLSWLFVQISILFFQIVFMCAAALLLYCSRALVNLRSSVMLWLLLVESKWLSIFMGKSNGLSKSKCTGLSKCNSKCNGLSKSNSICNAKTNSNGKSKRKSNGVSENKSNANSLMEWNVTNRVIVSAFAVNLAPNSKLSPGFFFVLVLICTKFQFLPVPNFHLFLCPNCCVFPFRPHGSVCPLS